MRVRHNTLEQKQGTAHWTLRQHTERVVAAGADVAAPAVKLEGRPDGCLVVYEKR
jgi:hypothetical protein